MIVLGAIFCVGCAAAIGSLVEKRNKQSADSQRQAAQPNAAQTVSQRVALPAKNTELKSPRSFPVPRLKQQQQTDNQSFDFALTNKQDDRLMSLPPHLRQYVDPNLHTDAELRQQQRDYESSLPAPPISGPKPQYDWRRQNDHCEPAAVDADPGAIAWSQNGEDFEYVDRPKLKLSRTFGRDGQRLHVEGNTVHHPTGRQVYSFPDREGDNTLRRMTGVDPHQRGRSAVMQPTLMPDCGLGPDGEWGDTRQLPGFALETQAIDALNEINVDNMADGMLPFIRPDLNQWREKPVSYAKPTPIVRDPIIPDTRAGIFYQANDIGAVPRFSEAMPALPGTDAYKRRAESAEHLQLPLEKNKGTKTRDIMSAPVPNLSLGPMARADQVPYEDVAHNMPGEARVAPRMLTAIKRYHKKLQQPHTLAYGAGVHDGDEAATSYDGVRVDFSVTNDRAANRLAAISREAPHNPLQSFTGLTEGDGGVDLEVGTGFDGFVLRDNEKDLQRDYRVQNVLREDAALYYGASGDGEDEVGGVSHAVNPIDVRDATGQRGDQKRSKFGVRLESNPWIEEADGVLDGQNAIGSLGMSNRRANDDKRVTPADYSRSTITDAEISSAADSARSFALQVAESKKKDAQIADRSNSTAHMALLDGTDDQGFADRISTATGGERALLQAQRAAQRAAALTNDFKRSVAQFDEGEAPADWQSVSAGRLQEGSRVKADSQVRSFAETARNAGADAFEWESAAANVGVQLEKQRRPDARIALRDEHASALQHMDEEAGSAYDSHAARVHGDRVRAPKRDGVLLDFGAGGCDGLDEMMSVGFREQRVGTEEHRPVAWKREASIVRDERRREYDSDVLTNVSRATVSAPGADRPHQKFADREERMTNDVRNRYAADEFHNVVSNEMHVAPPQVHLSHKFEREDGRESSVNSKLKSRLRSESPRPASHMERNSRFGKMLCPSPSSTPPHSRPASPFLRR